MFLLACDRVTNANPKHNGRAPPGPGRCVEISVGDAIASQKQKILKRSARIKGKNKYFEISSRIENLGWESPSRFPCGVLGAGPRAKDSRGWPKGQGLKGPAQGPRAQGAGPRAKGLKGPAQGPKGSRGWPKGQRDIHVKKLTW